MGLQSLGLDTGLAQLLGSAARRRKAFYLGVTSGNGNLCAFRKFRAFRINNLLIDGLERFTIHYKQP
jgi:hypothetical protein